MVAQQVLILLVIVRFYVGLPYINMFNRTGHTLSFLGEVQLGKLDLQLKLEDAQGFGLPGGQLPIYYGVV